MRGEIEILPGYKIPLIELGHELERLAFAEFARGKFEMDFALLVGLGGDFRAASEMIANCSAGERSAVVERRLDPAFDRFAAIINATIRLDRQVNRLELILPDFENPFV